MNTKKQKTTPTGQSRIRAKKERIREWLELRTEGHTYREIATTYGVNITTVSKAVAKELAEIPQESAENYRTMILDRYEGVIKQGNRLVEIGYRSKGCELILKASAELRKLLGLDAPEKQDLALSGSISYAGQSEEEIIAMAKARYSKD